MRGDIKVYNHEYEKDFLNKTGPGPGKYENHISFKKVLQSSVRPSFPKVNLILYFIFMQAVRDMGDARKVLPGPADYNTDLPTWKKAFIQEMPKCAIPKAYRKFDIIKCNN